MWRSVKTISVFYFCFLVPAQRSSSPVHWKTCLAIPVPGNDGPRFLVVFVKKKKQRVSGEDF